MNDNNGFNNQFIVEENSNAIGNEPVVYDSYYNHQPRKTPWGLIFALLVIALVVLGSLWISGFFTPMDRQAEYNKLYNRVCSAAVDYANDNFGAAKSISGKIVYIKVSTLSDANLIEANLRNYVTNEPIPSSTDVRLEVMPDGNFECHGFMYPGDDTIKPVVTLKGDSTIYLGIGSNATDPGATAVDDKDGDITENIKRSGNVSTAYPGTYTVNYVVRDRSGNLSDPVIRKYIVQ